MWASQCAASVATHEPTGESRAVQCGRQPRTVSSNWRAYWRYSYDSVQYRAVQYSTAPPCRPPYIFLRQGGHPPVDPPPGYTRKYQDTDTRARTAAGCAVVKTGGTPPCRPPYIFLRQGGHPPVDPPPGYTRKYQDKHTRARTAAGCAVVKTGGTPPCRPPCILRRQGGHPPVDPPPGYTRRHTARHTFSYRYGTVPPGAGDGRAQRRGKNFVQSNDYEYEKCILIPEDYFRPAHV